MQALDLLLNRVSVGRLLAPAPDAAQRELMFRAALRAPDHGQLRPWRFITIEGDARGRLGELFAEAQAQDPANKAEVLDKARAMPLRAPLLLVVVACLSEHPKVPQEEQVLSAGCAAHGVLLAAQALGFGAIWRTGPLTHHPHVLAGLGLGANEKIVGFLYLGSFEGERRSPPALETAGFVSAWQG
ncbi:NAD(P)H nitroreductase [Aquipseudomonas alcaligenes]|uniref:NAD(P)H nitroreductase n=1 Tax=Aquipseudomonas alcaligenes TaxID=43263 RepID=UPI00374A613A